MSRANRTVPKRRSGPLVAAVCAALGVTACAAEPDLEFAAWHLPVPEGTPIIEYAPVPPAERDPDAVQLIEDLVIGGDVTDSSAVLYQPGAVVAGDDGTIYVADNQAEDIKVFDPDGTYLKTLGREGQGPGEFGSISGMGIAGGNLVVNDGRNNRFSVWTLDGDHVADHRASNLLASFWMQGLADGTILSLIISTGPEDREFALVRYDLEGQELGRLVQVPRRPLGAIQRSDRLGILQLAVNSLADPRLIAAVGTGEVVYASPAVDYQVLAIAGDGSVLWALRVAGSGPPITDTAKQDLIDTFVTTAALAPDEPIAAEDIDWPATMGALSTLATDGNGRLFVFGFEEMPGLGEQPDSWLVDVYSPAGERLASGTVPTAWSYAAGDYVYGQRVDENDENVIVRYRVVVNGE